MTVVSTRHLKFCSNLRLVGRYGLDCCTMALAALSPCVLPPGQRNPLPARDPVADQAEPSGAAGDDGKARLALFILHRGWLPGALSTQPVPRWADADYALRRQWSGAAPQRTAGVTMMLPRRPHSDERRRTFGAARQIAANIAAPPPSPSRHSNSPSASPLALPSASPFALRKK